MPNPISEIDIAARVAPASIRWPSTPVAHWDRMREAVEAARALVAEVDADCRAVEADGDLSPDGLYRRRTEIGRRASVALADFKPLRAAEEAVARAVALFESKMVDLPKPPNSVAEVALAQEVRAYVARQANPVGFVLGKLDDVRVVGAVLSAPPFLSGLDDEMLNVVRERARSALHPEQVKYGQEAQAALDHLQKGVDAAQRMVLARTETRLDRDGQVRGIREKVPGGIAA